MTSDFEGRLLEHRARVERFVATMIADVDLAADVTQETFRVALDRRHQLRDASRLGPWVCAIAVNLCRAQLRKAVQDDRVLAFDPASPRGTVLSSIVRRESAEALAVAIDRLPILLREALVLHAIEGLPYPEVAEMTGASPETLHVRVHRARRLLRKQLGSVVDTIAHGRRD